MLNCDCCCFVSGPRSRLGLGFGAAHAVAVEIEAMSVVHEPIEDGVGVGRIPESCRMPLISTMSCPRSRSARGIMH